MFAKSQAERFSGPKFDGNGIGQYRDTIEIRHADCWLFSSEMLTDDGQGLKSMEGKRVRSKSKTR